MGAGAAVPWDTCAEPDCQGARVGAGGGCLVHAPAEEQAQRSSTGRGVDLDGRGVRFNRAAVITLFDSLPENEAGGKLFGTVRLDGARFDNDVSFDNAEFAGPLSLTGAVFEGDTRFGGARFLAGIDCSEATFNGQAWFVGCRFAGPASFRTTRFAGAAWLQKSTFDGPAVFDGSVFTTNATFSSATFSGPASFSGVRFGAHARFDKATCAGGWRFAGATFRFEDDGPEGVVHDAATPTAPPPPGEARPRPVAAAPPPAKRRVSLLVPLLVVVLVAAAAFVVLRPDEKPTFKDYDFVYQGLRTRQPARFNPCQPVRYVVNLDRSPPDFMAALDQAIAEVSGATGIVFQSEGTTTEKARPMLPASEAELLGLGTDTRTYRSRYRQFLGRPSFQPDRYGRDRWAPVLISWESFEALRAPFRPSGVAAADPRDVGDVPVFVSGTVLLNSDAPARDLKPRIMHELGHVVGLSHVNTRSELMSTGEEATAWGPGDLEGLRRVGREAGCLESPPPAPD